MAFNKRPTAENIEKLRSKTNKKFPSPKRFVPQNPKKYIGDYHNIIARSMWEIKLMKWCDNNPSVIKWNSEDVVVPYFSSADGKMRNYHVDFLVQYKTNTGDTSTLLIEVKPYAQTIKPVKGRRKKPETYLQECYTYQVNQDKWAAASLWAKSNGMKFILMNEYDLGIRPIPKDGKLKR